MKIVRTAIVAASAMALALLATAPARAADPLGTWLTGDKKGKVKIVNCGDAICGSLTWLAERMGQDLASFPRLKRWFETIRARPAVKRAFGIRVEAASSVDMKDPKVRAILFGQTAR